MGYFRPSDTGHEHFLNSTGRHEHFLNSTGRHEHFLNSTGRHWAFLNSTCKIRTPGKHSNWICTLEPVQGFEMSPQTPRPLVPSQITGAWVIWKLPPRSILLVGREHPPQPGLRLSRSYLCRGRHRALTCEDGRERRRADARGGGGEGREGHWLFELGYQLRNYSPHFLTKDSPWFCHLQMYSPLFSWIPKNSPLKSLLSGEFSVLHENILPNNFFWKVSRTNLNTYTYNFIWCRLLDAKTLTVPYYTI